MIIEEITVTAFQQHTRIVGCEKTKRAICIDPGDGSDEIVQAIDQNGFELQAIACTHAHMDHIGGVAALKQRKPEAKIIIHPADEPIYEQLPKQPAWIGIPESQWAAYGTFLQTHGIRHIDLLPLFRSQSERGRQLYFAVDAHWNPAGHRAAARAVCAYLAAAGLVPHGAERARGCATVDR